MSVDHDPQTQTGASEPERPKQPANVVFTNDLSKRPDRGFQPQTTEQMLDGLWDDTKPGRHRRPHAVELGRLGSIPRSKLLIGAGAAVIIAGIVVEFGHTDQTAPNNVVAQSATPNTSPTAAALAAPTEAPTTPPPTALATTLAATPNSVYVPPFDVCADPAADNNWTGLMSGIMMQSMTGQSEQATDASCKTNPDPETYFTRQWSFSNGTSTPGEFVMNVSSDSALGQQATVVDQNGGVTLQGGLGSFDQNLKLYWQDETVISDPNGNSYNAIDLNNGGTVLVQGGNNLLMRLYMVGNGPNSEPLTNSAAGLTSMAGLATQLGLTSCNSPQSSVQCAG